MKYKIGDEVKIKEDNEYIHVVRKQLQECNHIVIISGIFEGYYTFEKISCYWKEKYIEGLVSVLSCKEFFSPMINRFKLMEL